MLPQINAIEQIRRLGWTNTPGNSIEYTYYTGIEPGNPSGTAGNIKSITYKDGNNAVVLTITYEYDVNDNVIKEYAL